VFVRGHLGRGKRELRQGHILRGCVPEYRQKADGRCTERVQAHGDGHGDAVPVRRGKSDVEGLEMSFDLASYIMGQTAGKESVELDGEIVCTDDGEGNVTITQGEEAVSNGD